MQDSKVFGLTGKPGSGKGTVVGLIRHAVGLPVPVHRFSDAMSACLRELGLETSRPNQQLISRVLREAFGQNVFNEAVYQRVIADDAEVVCVDGIRRPADIERLSTLPGFMLIHITAPQDVRWQRIRARADRPGDAELPWEDFLRQDDAETERLIPELGRQAKFTIDNSGSEEDLGQQVWRVVRAALSFQVMC